MFIQKCKTSAGFIDKRPDPGVCCSGVRSWYFQWLSRFMQAFFRSESHRQCSWWSTWWQI